MSKLKKLLPRLLCFLLISLVLGGTAFSWNARKLAGNSMPRPFGFGLSVVLSGSMEPTLHVNDLVIDAPADEYKPGDIVVYQAGGALVIHRLIESDGTTAVTKGDANNVPDEPFPVNHIKGKLVRVFPGLGKGIQFLQSPLCKLAILAAAFFLLFHSRKKEDEDAHAETEKIRLEIEKLKAEMLAAEEDKET